MKWNWEGKNANAGINKQRFSFWCYKAGLKIQVTRETLKHLGKKLDLKSKLYLSIEHFSSFRRWARIT